MNRNTLRLTLLAGASVLTILTSVFLSFFLTTHLLKQNTDIILQQLAQAPSGGGDQLLRTQFDAERRATRVLLASMVTRDELREEVKERGKLAGQLRALGLENAELKKAVKNLRVAYTTSSRALLPISTEVVDSTGKDSVRREHVAYVDSGGWYGFTGALLGNRFTGSVWYRDSITLAAYDTRIPRRHPFDLYLFRPWVTEYRYKNWNRFALGYGSELILPSEPRRKRRRTDR